MSAPEATPGHAPPLHLDRAPPRDTALPFLYTAPLALVVAGVLLVRWGALALTTPWAAPTLALTHVGTLGFLTMVCIAAVVLAVPLAGGGTLPRPLAAHVVYYALIVGVGGLTWGVAHAQAGPVFTSIAAVGVLGIAFLVQATWAHRRGTTRSATTLGLGVALWSFFLAASLGIWLAHGHGGMKFPGPRPIWLQVHLTVGLVGWVGGTLAALTWQIASARLGGESVREGSGRAVAGAIALGVTAPTVLLLAQFFGAVSEEAGWLPAAAALLAAPALVAVWVVQPVLALRALRGAPERGAVLFWRTGLGLGPFVLAAGGAAFLVVDPRAAILFGWLAVVGWAGTSVQALLLGVLPWLAAPAADDAWDAAASGAEGWQRVAFFLHVAALVVGAVSIVSGRDELARITGGLLAAAGAALMAAVVRGSAPSGGPGRA